MNRKWESSGKPEKDVSVQRQTREEHYTEGTQNIYNKIVQEVFSNLQKEMPTQVQRPTEL